MPESVVYAKFQSDAEAIRPGGRFLLALHLDIVGDYRISWTNPGDIGRGTNVRFSAPEGFVVGPVRFPAPTRFEGSDGTVSYGYEDETAVFAEVTAPEQLSPSEAYRFDVAADWVACKRECATEELNAWFEMVASSSAPAPRLSAALQRHYEAIPQPLSELPTSRLDWEGRRSLTLQAPQVRWLDYFPGSLEQPKLESMRKAGDRLTLRFEQGPKQPIVGLAVGEIDGKTSFFDVRVPTPTAP